MSADEGNQRQDGDWEELVDRAEDILTEVASRPEKGRELNTIYYSELNRELGDPFAMDTPRGLSGMSVLLAEVSKRSYADKGVMLSAVVLSKKNGMPGPGFFKLARDAGWMPPGDENDSFFYKELRRAQRRYREG